MIHSFYALPIWEMILIMLLLVLLWGIIGRVCTSKRGCSHCGTVARLFTWNNINCCLAIIWIAFIIYMTLYCRTVSNRELVLMPFRFIIDARKQPEIYRSMIANIMLFVPLGMFTANGIVPVIFEADRNVTSKCMIGKQELNCIRAIAYTVLIGLALSICIESLQYALALGRTEVDDLIMNALGSGIGGLSRKVCTARPVFCNK